jgi:hypothetical protein
MGIINFLEQMHKTWIISAGHVQTDTYYYY